VTEPTGERFIPEAMGGQLIEAEHHARYRFAAQHVAGRRVLDAGCGVGWGTELLLDAGARSAVGVDIAPDAVRSAQARAARGRFVVGDLLDLPFARASFDLVTCFEAIEHVADASKALDELRRVLTPDGLLVVSSPNPAVYPAGNPFHVRELTPDELHAELQSRFTSAVLWRQYDLAASVLTDGAPQVAHEPIRGEARAVTALPGHEDIYSVVTATSGTLPTFGSVAMFAPPNDRRTYLAAYESSRRECDALQGRLRACEERLLRVTTEWEHDRARAAAEVGDLRRQLDELRASTSWRVTAPLRRVSDALRRSG
jgi:SAM-dependent methyltransferase